MFCDFGIRTVRCFTSEELKTNIWSFVSEINSSSWVVGRKVGMSKTVNNNILKWKVIHRKNNNIRGRPKALYLRDGSRVWGLSSIRKRSSAERIKRLSKKPSMIDLTGPLKYRALQSYIRFTCWTENVRKDLPQVILSDKKK